MPHPPQELAYRCDEYGDFVLSVGRLDRAKRIDLLLDAAKRGGFPVVVAGDGPDRERLESLADGSRALPRPGLRGGARRPVRALPRRLLRARGRGLRDGAVRGVPRGEAGRDHDRRGRAARGRRRPRHRARLRAARGGARGRVRVARRPPRGRAAWGRAGRELAQRVSWDATIDRLLAMRVAYYSPLPPSRSGIADYSALLLPALAERVDVVVARRGRFRREPKADVCLYHVGNDPAEHGWIVEALRRRPGIVVLHEFVLHHLVSGITLARGDVEGYLAALERDAGLVGRLLGHAAIDERIKPLWETRPQDFPLSGEILDLATGLIVHSATSRSAPARPATTAPSGGCRCRPGRCRTVEPEPVEGSPLLGCFGHVNESKRVPQLCAAFSRLRERRPDARLLLVGSWSPRLPRLDLPGGRDPRGVRAGGTPLGAPRRLRRGRLAPLADDGRDLRRRDPRALARQAARRQRRRLVLGAARTTWP